MQIFKLCSLDFSSCYKVCNILGIEVFFCRIAGAVTFGFRV